MPIFLDEGKYGGMFTRRQLRILILPLIVEQFLAVTIGMADSVMVASCGEASVSGVSLVDSLNILLINIFSALATGGAIVSAQFIGREEPENASRSAKQLLYVVTAVSTLVMAVCLVGGGGLLSLLFGKAEADVMTNAQVYFFWSALSYPFIAVYNAGAALFRAMGNSRVSMTTSILMNAINICGNAILIFGFQMGVAGAAIATLVSRLTGAVLIVSLLRYRPHTIQLPPLLRWEFRPRMIRQILTIGIPNGLENGMFQVGKILLQSLITSFGTVALTANAVANTVAMLPQIPGSAIGLALITVVGQCIGAGRYDEAKRYTLRLTGLAYTLMAGLCALEAVFAPALVFCFQLSEASSALTVQLLIYHGILCALFWPAAFVLPNGLRAANDVRFTMCTSILSMGIFRIGFSYLLAQGLQMGVLGVWMAMTIDWVVRAAVFFIRLLSGGWKKRQLL